MISKKTLQKLLALQVTFFAICHSYTLAEKIEQEGIFIEAISEFNKGSLSIDEIRTRPATFSTSSKNFLVEADGYYIAEETFGESTYVATDRARMDARRALSEQIDLYVKSVSETQNGKLTRDEIHTISVILMQIYDETITTENLETHAISYHCHIKAFVDDSSILDQLDSVSKEQFRETVRQTIEIEKETARINAELNALKQRYKNASSSEQNDINSKLKHNGESINALMLNEQAHVANYRGDFDRAIEYCYKAIEVDPDSFVAWNNLGYAYGYKGNLDKAIECYERAIELNSNDVTSQINIGSVYDSIKQYETAMEHYQRALSIDPNNADALNNIGYAYIQKSDFDNGIEYCRKAVKIDPHNAAAWNGLGYSYNQKKKYYKAVECCRKAVALNKNYANAWNNLGYACSKINRLEEAYVAYMNAIKVAPNIQLYRNNFEIAKKRIDSIKSL